MKKKQTSRTTPTSGATTRRSNPFSWSPGYEPKGKECDSFGGRPTIFEYSSTTHRRVQRVKWLRKAIGMNMSEVALNLGYSPSKIVLFECGYDRLGKAIADHKWRRYLMALIGLFCLVKGYAKEIKDWREDAQGHARVQARQSAPGNRQTRKKGRQGHRPKAGDRHRVE